MRLHRALLLPVLLVGLTAACSTARPTPTPSPVDLPVASATPTRLMEPSASPAASPTIVRFDVTNGSRLAMVWLRTDLGSDAGWADMRGLHPGERGSFLAPVVGVVGLDVYGDGCVALAHLQWFPGSGPVNIVLSDSAEGYDVTIGAHVAGSPVPKSQYLYGGCSG